jgi:acetamidase/formamidase
LRHVLNPDARHYSWDREEPAALSVESGDEVVLQIGYAPDHPTKALQPGFGMPLSGPIWVRGAEPGDAIEVRILDVVPERSGYTAIGQGFGLLPDGEVAPYRHHWDLGPTGKALFKNGIAVPIAPFLGVLGVAPDTAGSHPTLPPGRHGGNLDIRHLTVGARLWLPVLVEGAKLSAGDMHAAQGDGEVCGTAIETWGSAVIGVRVRKGLAIRFPQFRPPWREGGPEQWHCTTGIGPDLKEAAAEAIREMIAYLVRDHGLSKSEAYALCSVAADLRIAEIVDKPNWIVAAFLSLGIFATGFTDSFEA